MTTLSQAQAVFQHAIDELTAMLAAKGYPRAHAEIWLGRDTVEAAVVINHDVNSPAPPIGYIPRGRDVAIALANARREIAMLPDPRANDPWFDWSADINQPPKAA